MQSISGVSILAFQIGDCGGLRLEIAATRAVLRHSGALWLEAERTMVVADLHFEKGSSYAARFGQMLPPYDTRETLDRLERELAALSPATLVFLGDSFHDGAGEDRLPDEDRARIAALAVGRQLVWVVGNHDADGPRALPGDVDRRGRDRRPDLPPRAPARRPARRGGRPPASGGQGDQRPGHHSAALLRHRRQPPGPAGLRGASRAG